MLDARGAAVPAIIHWGADLGGLSPEQLEAFADSRIRVVGNSSIDEPLRVGIVPLAAEGWTGLAGLEGRHDRVHRRPVLRNAGVARTFDGISVSLVDDADGAAVLRIVVDLRLDEHGVLHSRSTASNLAEEPYELLGLATVLPVPGEASERLDFTGTWAAERSPQRAVIDHGTALRESRHGRGGHDDSYLTIAGTFGFGFGHGEVWATHLAWSGDKRTWIDRSTLGVTTVGAAELLAPGEIRLATGEEYATPWTLAAWSASGLDGVSARFHALLRNLPAHPSSPRPLTLNTWEAVYFDQSLERLGALADLAASVGVERFVLDDGWMTGRADAKGGLGDWTVDATTWPEGLGPLIERVHAGGMEFGLWVEPEMVSLDSHTAREHPEWVLREASKRLPLPWRGQYVLDLSIEAAREHVRDALLALLDEYPIRYLKWDMNRDLLGGSVHGHVLATYRLMDELRERHTGLEIESCSSGGARIDAEMLRRTERVWPSDTNDAHDRQSIMRWTSVVVPPEYLGSHVGSAPAHTTGRSHSLSFRLATALFGHAGIEWDLSLASPAELEALRVWGEQYKLLRGVIHTGRLVRGDDAECPSVTGVVAPDGSDAVYWLVCLDVASGGTTPVCRLPGLDESREYRVTVVELGAPVGYQGTPPAWIEDGATLSGTVLGSVGIESPVLLPDEAVVLRVTAVS